jgi:UDP-N-acetylmuramyl pentapeptide phosphotransferase/UDP-N-acetylglucosamine-1-phosphate transferase
MTDLLLHSLIIPVTAALILFFRHYAPQLGVVDVPGGRKHHHGDIPLVGGLAMFGGLSVAALFAVISGTFSASIWPSSPRFRCWC